MEQIVDSEESQEYELTLLNDMDKIEAYKLYVTKALLRQVGKDVMPYPLYISKKRQYQDYAKTVAK